MRAKVWRLRMNSELFDVGVYTANLERVYRKMWERHENGDPVDHITELAEPYSWLAARHIIGETKLLTTFSY